MTARLILVLQNNLAKIDEAMARLVLTESDRALPANTVTIDDPDLGLGDAADIDWPSAQATVLAAYREQIEPARQSGSRVAYFGATPIPLAMQLGYLLGSWGAVDVYQRNHETGSWAWVDRRHPPPAPIIEGVPKELRSEAPFDVILRVSTWPEIDREATRRVVGAAHFEVDIRLERPAPDALERPEDVDAVAAAFQSVLDDLSDRLPQATIHLFAAVPVGLALRMGMRVSPTMHRPIQVYQRVAREDARFHAALVLQGVPTRAPRVLSASERERAAAERAIWREELRVLRERATEQAEPDSWRRWSDDAGFSCPPWTLMPNLSRVVGALGDVDVERTTVTGGFELDRSTGKWLLDDELLLSLAHRQESEADRRLAARLFFLHEALHHEVQRLTSVTSRRVGRLPHVLEELDYQADVWAFLQELAAARAEDSTSNLLGLLRGMVRVATETFWAFDDDERPLLDLEVRRVNRYLIWYWQVLRLERVPTFDAALAVLSRKPTLELAGLRTSLRDNRPVCSLDVGRARGLEFGVVEGITLERRYDGHASPLEELVDGLRLRSPEVITRALRGVFDNIADV